MTSLTRCLWIRRGVAIVLLPLLLLVTTLPLSAFIDFSGAIQRAAMIANQVSMIRNQVAMIANLGDQVDELKAQLAQMQNEALGHVGALGGSFEALSADPAHLLGDRQVEWAGDFTGDALPYVQVLTSMSGPGNVLVNQWRQQLAAADQVGPSDIQGLFSDPAVGRQAVEEWEAQREIAKRRRVSDYAAGDAAEAMRELLAAAQNSFAKVRGKMNTNVSVTALGQAQVANQFTLGELQIAVTELAALREIREADERRNNELVRLRDIERWVAAEQTSQTAVAAAQAANAARGEVYKRALLLPQRFGRAGN